MPARRPPRKAHSSRRRRVRRRRLVVLGVVAVGLTSALGAGLLGGIDDRIREVTLPLRHDDIIRQQSRDKGLDPSLIAAMIFAESKFRPRTSSAGAEGLMQILPETARFIAKTSGGNTFEDRDLANPDINIRYGSYYLRYLLDRYDGNTVAAIAAYNAGHTNVDRWGGTSLTLDDVRFDETQHYVAEVLAKRRDYRRHYAKELGLPRPRR